MNLYRNNAGGVFPYSLSGIINITGSSAGGAYYYYFYNWQVQKDPCVSVRTPVQVTIGSPAVTYASSYDTLCVSDAAVALSGGLPAGGIYSGTGVNSGLFDPAIAGAGTQTITYSYSDANGCSSLATQDLYVDACAVSTGIASTEAVSGVAVYPNPTRGEFTLELGLIKDEKAELKIMNSLGQIIRNEAHTLISGNNKLTIDFGREAKGVYVIQLKTASTVLIRRITKE
jgi:hypothetical protein